MTYSITKFTSSSKQLSTRSLAKAISEKIFNPEDTLDFTPVEMVSSAFADELSVNLQKKQIEPLTVIKNANQDVKRMFKVVQLRRSIKKRS